MTPPLGLLYTFEFVLLAYFVILNATYFTFAITAAVSLWHHRRQWSRRHFSGIIQSSSAPGVSVIVPAYNEERTIVTAVQSLLQLNYPRLEIVVVNDGSRDATLQRLIDAFSLRAAADSRQPALPTAGVRAVLTADGRSGLVVVDKVNGGKADAINAGINASTCPLVCTIDADSVLDPNALARVVLPFIEDAETVAVGAAVCIVNGCQVSNGSVRRAGLAARPLAALQAAEYLRAFVAARIAQASANALLILSGAFAVFRRDALLRVGGFSVSCLGEDMEVVVRLHRFFRERQEPYRIAFQPDPVCWTECPESLRVLAAQRTRWQQGLLQVLAKHRVMLLNPRYGLVGLVSMPYHVVFEALGPVLEVVGCVVTIVAVLGGWLDWQMATLIFLLAIVAATLVSIASVLLEEMTFRRYPRVRDLLILVAASILEHIGFRQLCMLWRCKGIIDFLNGRQGWGEMTRKGFTSV